MFWTLQYMRSSNDPSSYRAPSGFNVVKGRIHQEGGCFPLTND